MDDLSNPNVSKNGSLRFNKNKAPLHLVPPEVMTAIAEVLGEGAKKYGERNWEKGAEFSVPYASAMRHLLKFWGGEDIDPETGKLHIAHCLTNLMMLLHYYNNFPELDDRSGK